MTSTSSSIDSDRPLIPAIVGPTATGKTGLALELVDDLNAEMVSCDSRQIYKYMTIGTAKPTEAELQGKPCHLIDFVEPSEIFSAAKYRLAAVNCIDDILRRGKLPIIVGGTGLYLQALSEGLFETPEADLNLRRELEQLSSKELYRRLEMTDPQTAAEVSQNNRVRIIRALEIACTTGSSKAELAKSGKYPPKKYRFLVFGLTCYREKLYQIINARVDKMIDDGFVAEVEKLQEMGYGDSVVLQKTVGYKEILQFLKGEVDLSKCIELIKQKTRNYAKRQVTWFKRVPDLTAVDTFSRDRRKIIISHLRQIKS